MSVSCKFSVRCRVEVSATGRSPVQRSPTECGVSECDSRNSTIRRSRSTRAAEPKTKCVSPNSRCQSAAVKKFRTVAYSSYGAPSVWNLLHVALLARRILMWFLNIWKSCERLRQMQESPEM